jgi:hypothetical protein
LYLLVIINNSSQRISEKNIPRIFSGDLSETPNKIDKTRQIRDKPICPNGEVKNGIIGMPIEKSAMQNVINKMLAVRYKYQLGWLV